MKKVILFLSLSYFLFSNNSFAKDPKVLIEEMVKNIGGQEKLYALKDVQYQYTYHDLSQNKKDVSIERYIFDGEFSWAKYTIREKAVAPELAGEMIQGYDGSNSWVSLDGKLLEDPKIKKLGDFLRKTNFYWFTMMFKLLDPGIHYEYAGIKKNDNIAYDLVKITFAPNIGDVQDHYLLYLNPQTKLVDQFLFTVMDFNLSEPFLMKVEYQKIEGIQLPVKRKYVRADWKGVAKDNNWSAEISTNIVFNNGFSKSMFQQSSER